VLKTVKYTGEDFRISITRLNQTTLTVVVENTDNIDIINLAIREAMMSLSAFDRLIKPCEGIEKSG